MSYSTMPQNLHNPLEEAFRAAKAQEAFEKDLYLRAKVPDLVRSGYHLDELQMEETTPKIELLSTQFIYSCHYRLGIGRSHSRRMLAFRRRMRRFKRGVGWYLEKRLGMLR